MTYFIIIAIAAVVTVILFTLTATFFKLYRNQKRLYEEEHSRLLLIQEEYSKLAEAYRIKKENKEKADEKISDLHNGTVSADDVLPKRKGRS